MVAALRHFRFLLERRKFHVLTDHKPLVYTLHRARDAWSARQGCHLAYVAEFTSDLRHVPRSTQVACVKAPSGSLAAPVARDGSYGASTAAAAVVTATQQGARGPSGGQSWHVSS